MHEPNKTDDILTTDSNQKFRIAEVIRDPDGVVAVISERLSDGRVSFMIAREFELKGETKRSAYLNTRHVPAVRRLLADIEERLELMEDRARARLRDRNGSTE